MVTYQDSYNDTFFETNEVFDNTVVVSLGEM
jgi:hypothetical protein